MSEVETTPEGERPELEREATEGTKTAEKKPESLRSTIGTVTFAVAIALLIRMVACEPFQIEGPSMEPSLLDGDRVIVSKFAYGLTLYFVEDALVTWALPELGDVVILTSTAADKAVIVKRVVGLPGDVIEFRDDLAFRNGEPLRVGEIGHCAPGEQRSPDPSCRVYEERVGDREFHISQSAHFDGYYESRRVVVPDGHVYVLGDHRDESRDSRAVGPIPAERVKGRVEAIYLSVSGTGRVRTDRIFHSVK
jgi:signal peptidase I